MSYERANTDDTIDDYKTVTGEFLDYVLARFTVMYPNEARQLILNDSCFYSLATLLNELFAPRPHRRCNKGHKRTLINVVTELESSNISIDQNPILSSVRLQFLIAVLDTDSEEKTMPSEEEDYKSDSSQETMFRWRDKSTETMFRWRDQSTDKAIQVCYIMY